MVQSAALRVKTEEQEKTQIDFTLKIIYRRITSRKFNRPKLILYKTKKKFYVAENNMLHRAVVKFQGGCDHNSAPEILNYIIYRSRQFMHPYSITRRKL